MSEGNAAGSVMHNAGQTEHEWDVMEPDLLTYYTNTAILFLHHAGISVANYYFISSNKILPLDK